MSKTYKTFEEAATGFRKLYPNAPYSVIGRMRSLFMLANEEDGMTIKYKGHAIIRKMDGTYKIAENIW